MMGGKHIDKKCGRCREWKPVGDYYPSKKGTFLRDGYCKKCRRELDRQRQDRSSAAVARMMKKDPWYYRRNNLRILYGITPEQLMSMYDRQKGCCAICGIKDSGNKHGLPSLHVDHNHATGKIRGLLCQSCNVKLGAVENDQFCRLAEEYLYDCRSDTCQLKPSVRRQ